MPVAMSSAPVGSSQSSTSGPLRDGAGDGDPLLLAAGQLRRKVIQPARSRPTRRSASSGAIGSPAISVTSATFSRGGQAGDQVVELEDEADVVAAIARQPASSAWVRSWSR